MSAVKKLKYIIAADHSVRCIKLSKSEIRGEKLEENGLCFFFNNYKIFAKSGNLNVSKYALIKIAK